MNSTYGQGVNFNDQEAYLSYLEKNIGLRPDEIRVILKNIHRRNQ